MKISVSPILWLVLALIAVGAAWKSFGFEKMTAETPEKPDTSQADRTDRTMHSSYLQRTNHMIPDQATFGPIQGSETPFRVNMFQAFLP